MTDTEIKQKIQTIRKIAETAMNEMNAIVVRDCIKKLKKLDKMLYEK